MNGENKKNLFDKAVDYFTGFAEIAENRLKKLTGKREPKNTRQSFWAGLPRVIRYSTTAFIVLVVAVSVAYLTRYTPSTPLKQPIPFSHRFHVQTKNLSCPFCHTSVRKSAEAGIPPVEKCLLCHNVIAPNYQPISLIHDYWNSRKPVPWRRVNRVPRFTRFSHQPHISRGIDCGRCHGNVKGMDIVYAAQRFDMNFCITCHWRYNAPVTCYRCHY
jgi:hypothetical protein